MLAISVRDKPCSARTLPSSLGRVTRRTLSSLTTAIGSATVRLREPFGPLTLTAWPSMATSTPLGMGMGRRPMRDIVVLPSLPDVGEDFPAHTVLLGLLVGHQAARRRDDRDAEPAEHPGQVVLLGVHPKSGLGDPLDPGDRALPGVAVLQRDHEVLADFGILDAPPRDVVVSRVSVAQTGQHVRDRVGH